MSTSDHMRRLIDLANGNSPAKPEVVKESSGSPLKDFARWGKINEAEESEEETDECVEEAKEEADDEAETVEEAWGGEPGSDSVNVYQDKDPLGTGEWFWTRSVNGHIVASGSAPTEDEAERAANMKEDMLVTPELDEDGVMGEPSVMHLLKPRGGSECGAACDEDTCSPEINEVNCPACIEGHEEYMKQFEMSHDGDLDTMYAKHTGVEEADHEAPFELSAEPEMEPKQVADDTVDTVTGPSYWASYLVNGDDSSLTPEEKAHADAWLARLGDWSVVGIADGEDGESQESRFTWSYDIHSGTDTRGGDVVDYVIHKHQPVGEELLNDDILDEDAAGLHIDYVFDIDDLPEDIRDECISDCSGQGDVGEAVEYWVKRLNFTVNRDKAIRCLNGYGMDRDWENEDDETIAKNIFWLACGNFSEWDGNEDGESASGSPQFVLEAKA